METYSELTMKDAIDFATRNPSGLTIPNTESFATLWRVHTGVNLQEPTFVAISFVNRLPSLPSPESAATHLTLPGI